MAQDMMLCLCITVALPACRQPGTAVCAASGRHTAHRGGESPVCGGPPSESDGEPVKFMMCRQGLHKQVLPVSILLHPLGCQQLQFVANGCHKTAAVIFINVAAAWPSESLVRTGPTPVHQPSDT